jgi:hypothetical protein
VKLLFGASDVKLNVRGGLKVTHYPKVIDLISCLPAPLYRRALVKGTRRGAR